jgi:3' terminal RNA ribose 2'-O-methyltransferase Hen1
MERDVPRLRARRHEGPRGRLLDGRGRGGQGCGFAVLLTITTTHQPATDLGFLLAKNPARCQTFSLPAGEAHVFYPVATAERCTAALLLDLDPVGLVRGRGDEGEGPLAQYVNDRPYVASSFLAVAMARVFASAMKGTSRERPNLADVAIPLEAELPVMPCRGGEAFLRALFEPLGYAVDAKRVPLDPRFRGWGESPYFAVRVSATCRLRDLLTHLYVLVPVLDDDKHYWVGDDELEKLVQRGEGWLGTHPERDRIARRYLRHQRSLYREALERLVAEEDPDLAEKEVERDRAEAAIEQELSLDQMRIGTVIAMLKQAGARRVIDLGCGEGKLVRALLEDRTFERVVGMDVSPRALEIARDRLHFDRMAPAQRERVELFQGSLGYRDERMGGFDAACAIEVIEHLDPPRLPAFERVVFQLARPRVVILTTPNVEHNVRFETLPAGKLRHRDHRFEWTRAELRAWAEGVAERAGYSVRFAGVGADDPEVGPPTQLALFERGGE